jgi:PPM family protein phosphatase
MRHLKSAQGTLLSEDEVREGFDSAHHAVRTTADARQVRMGCTLVAALVSENEALIANVGDSRCYVVSGGAIECITVDHSLSFSALACEHAADDVPVQNPFAHILTRSVGTEALPPAVDLWRLPVSGSGSFVLCSDGIHSALSQETIRQAVRLPPQQAASELVRQAVAAGAGDDLSVAILSFDS